MIIIRFNETLPTYDDSPVFDFPINALIVCSEGLSKFSCKTNETYGSNTLFFVEAV